MSYDQYYLENLDDGMSEEEADQMASLDAHLDHELGEWADGDDCEEELDDFFEE
jgi:hypothetical protein